MARGIGGDDGPSIFMFAACILIFGQLKSWFNKAGDKANELANKNYANPFQQETTSEIDMMTKNAKKISVNWKALPPAKNITYFQRLALSHKQVMDTQGNMDEDKLFSQVEKLTANELRALAYCFGVQDRTNGLISIWTGDIFMWYDKGLDDITLYPGYITELARMRAIWAKTGLWLS